MSLSELKAQLLAGRNPDGGWPYYAGKSSRLEPTAWALLALQAAGEPVTADALTGWPRRDGWFVDRNTDAINIAFNSLAGLALVALRAPRDAFAPVTRALVALKGRQLPQQPDIIAQDNALQAWPWVDGTFSWVEPTSLAVVFLKRARTLSPDDALNSRLDEAERLLVDRACAGGGWNYGNSNIFGVKLDAYVPTSALALLALADKPTLGAVTRGKAFLKAHRLSERSAMALGLTRIALGVHGVKADDVTAALDEAAADTAFLENLHLTAMALYAEAGARGGYEALRV